jgi:uncharacterized protein (TIGR02300 family)
MSLNAERGTKRTCQNTDCGSRFYDLGRTSIVCPICSARFTIAEPVVVAARRAFQRSPYPFSKSPVAVAAQAEPESASVEIVSLEDGATDQVAGDIDDIDEKLLEQDEDPDPAVEVEPDPDNSPEA